MFARDLLKSVHMTASACTAMFVNGIADCKIGMERMSTAECVQFMAAVAGNVLRERGRQTLSAAFNINTPVVDEHGATITDPMRIAQIGIDLAAAGGFDKVTWDGAVDKVPSDPVIGQLSHAQLLTLVHAAHGRGLETYISAGLQAHHMRDAVFLGVGGVGIGTSLHYIDPATRLMGALKAEAIREVLEIRDAAAGEPFGRAAALLARLDRMFFEGSLNEADEPHRTALFEALRDKSLDAVRRLLDTLSHIGAMTPMPAQAHPAVATGRRLVQAAATGRPILWTRLGASAFPATIARLQSLLATDDAAGIEELLWTQ